MSPSVTIRLHPAQKAFRDSDATFRGFVGGRGAGKSFIGAYDLLRRAKPGRLYGAYAPTYKMLQDAAMRSFVEIGQGLAYIREVNKADMRVTLGNGAEVLFRSLDNPESARGPNLSGAWLDEASLVAREAYSIVIACLRQGGEQGWLSATFTPKGMAHWTYDVFGTGKPGTALFHARTKENPFLPPTFYDAVRAQYTSFLAQQELEGEFIGDMEGALWRRSNIEQYRVPHAPPLFRVVVAIDPAATNTEGSDETGIVVAGLDELGDAYVLDDLSLKASPHTWGTQAVNAYRRYQADRIVAEVNNGGDMVELTIRTVDLNASYKAVHASRGKMVRAEPVAALYEQGRVHHVGTLPDLENQLCQWVPGDKSPDRLDALVWAITELMLESEEEQGLYVYDERVAISPY